MAFTSPVSIRIASVVCCDPETYIAWGPSLPIVWCTVTQTWSLRPFSTHRLVCSDPETWSLRPFFTLLHPRHSYLPLITPQQYLRWVVWKLMHNLVFEGCFARHITAPLASLLPLFSILKLFCTIESSLFLSHSFVGLLLFAFSLVYAPKKWGVPPLSSSALLLSR